MGNAVSSFRHNGKPDGLSWPLLIMTTIVVSGLSAFTLGFVTAVVVVIPFVGLRAVRSFAGAASDILA